MGQIKDTGSELILGIETSCDETAAAVVAGGRQIFSNIISSQVEIHQKYGGVVPEIASRKHLQNITLVVEEALNQAGVDFPDLDAVAVTYGPGLVGALLVGLSAAKAIAYARGIPLIGVNHLEGHIYANWLEHEFDFPVLCLVVSGGHTDLVYWSGHGCYELLGSTRDDAAGEAFDKVARILGLGYPGGPLIEKLARQGNQKTFVLPRAKLPGANFDFSFSGLKTAVKNTYDRLVPIDAQEAADLAAEFQAAVVDVLVDKTYRAAQVKEVKTVCLAGGVAANSFLRSKLSEHLKEAGINLYYPAPVFCTDNAAMIACAGYIKYKKRCFSDWTLNVEPGITLPRNCG